MVSPPKPKLSKIASQQQQQQQQQEQQQQSVSQEPQSSQRRTTSSSNNKVKLVKGPKPLIHHRFYLDIERHQIATKIESNIKELGGSVEFFLNKGITHFITDKHQIGVGPPNTTVAAAGTGERNDRAEHLPSPTAGARAGVGSPATTLARRFVGTPAATPPGTPILGSRNRSHQHQPRQHSFHPTHQPPTHGQYVNDYGPATSRTSSPCPPPITSTAAGAVAGPSSSTSTACISGAAARTAAGTVTFSSAPGSPVTAGGLDGKGKPNVLPRNRADAMLQRVRQQQQHHHHHHQHQQQPQQQHLQTANSPLQRLHSSPLNSPAYVHGTPTKRGSPEGTPGSPIVTSPAGSTIGCGYSQRSVAGSPRQNSPVQLARSWGTPVWSTEQTLKFLRKVHDSVQNENRHRAVETAVRGGARGAVGRLGEAEQQHRTNRRHHHHHPHGHHYHHHHGHHSHQHAHHLRGQFIKIECRSTPGNYRPVYQEFKRWPVLLPAGKKFSSKQAPFADAKQAAATQAPTVAERSTVVQREDDNGDAVGGGGTGETMTRKLLAATPATTKTTDKSEVAVGGKRKQQSQEKTTPPAPAPPKDCGYCEICRIEYDSLAVHVQSESHRAFVQNDDNFLSLDRLLGSLGNAGAGTATLFGGRGGGLLGEEDTAVSGGGVAVAAVDDLFLRTTETAPFRKAQQQQQQQQQHIATAARAEAKATSCTTTTTRPKVTVTTTTTAAVDDELIEQREETSIGHTVTERQRQQQQQQQQAGVKAGEKGNTCRKKVKACTGGVEYTEQQCESSASSTSGSTGGGKSAIKHHSVEHLPRTEHRGEKVNNSGTDAVGDACTGDTGSGGAIDETQQLIKLALASAVAYFDSVSESEQGEVTAQTAGERQPADSSGQKYSNNNRNRGVPTAATTSKRATSSVQVTTGDSEIVPGAGCDRATEKEEDQEEQEGELVQKKKRGRPPRGTASIAGHIVGVIGRFSRTVVTGSAVEEAADTRKIRGRRRKTCSETSVQEAGEGEVVHGKDQQPQKHSGMFGRRSAIHHHPHNQLNHHTHQKHKSTLSALLLKQQREREEEKEEQQREEEYHGRQLVSSARFITEIPTGNNQQPPSSTSDHHHHAAGMKVVTTDFRTTKAHEEELVVDKSEVVVVAPTTIQSEKEEKKGKRGTATVSLHTAAHNTNSNTSSSAGKRRKRRGGPTEEVSETTTEGNEQQQQKQEQDLVTMGLKASTTALSKHHHPHHHHPHHLHHHHYQHLQHMHDAVEDDGVEGGRRNVVIGSKARAASSSVVPDPVAIDHHHHHHLLECDGLDPKNTKRISLGLRQNPKRANLNEDFTSLLDETLERTKTGVPTAATVTTGASARKGQSRIRPSQQRKDVVPRVPYTNRRCEEEKPGEEESDDVVDEAVQQEDLGKSTSINHDQHRQPHRKAIISSVSTGVASKRVGKKGGGTGGARTSAAALEDIKVRGIRWRAPSPTTRPPVKSPLLYKVIEPPPATGGSSEGGDVSSHVASSSSTTAVSCRKTTGGTLGAAGNFTSHADNTASLDMNTSSGVPGGQRRSSKATCGGKAGSPKKNGIIVKIRRVRQSELSLLNDEAENFMFPRKDDSSSEVDTDDDRQTSSEGNRGGPSRGPGAAATATLSGVSGNNYSIDLPSSSEGDRVKLEEDSDQHEHGGNNSCHDGKEIDEPKEEMALTIKAGTSGVVAGGRKRKQAIPAAKDRARGMLESSDPPSSSSSPSSPSTAAIESATPTIKRQRLDAASGPSTTRRKGQQLATTIIPTEPDGGSRQRFPEAPIQPSPVAAAAPMTSSSMEHRTRPRRKRPSVRLMPDEDHRLPTAEHDEEETHDEHDEDENEEQEVLKDDEQEEDIEAEEEDEEEKKGRRRQTASAGRRGRGRRKRIEQEHAVSSTSTDPEQTAPACSCSRVTAAAIRRGVGGGGRGAGRRGRRGRGAVSYRGRGRGRVQSAGATVCHCRILDATRMPPPSGTIRDSAGGGSWKRRSSDEDSGAASSSQQVAPATPNTRRKGGSRASKTKTTPPSSASQREPSPSPSSHSSSSSSSCAVVSSCYTNNNGSGSSCIKGKEDGMGAVFKWINFRKRCEEIEPYRFAFERVPSLEPWYETFQRQDDGTEKVYEYFGSTGYRKLPYEMGPLPALGQNCCILNYKVVACRKSNRTASLQSCSSSSMEPTSPGKRHSSSRPCSADTAHTAGLGASFSGGDAEAKKSSPSGSSLSSLPLKKRKLLLQQDAAAAAAAAAANGGDKVGVSAIDAADGPTTSTNGSRISRLIAGANNERPRKSPREHASTLAILSLLQQQQHRKRAAAIKILTSPKKATTATATQTSAFMEQQLFGHDAIVGDDLSRRSSSRASERGGGAGAGGTGSGGGSSSGGAIKFERPLFPDSSYVNSRTLCQEMDAFLTEELNRVAAGGRVKKEYPEEYPAVADHNDDAELRPEQALLSSGEHEGDKHEDDDVLLHPPPSLITGEGIAIERDNLPVSKRDLLDVLRTVGSEPPLSLKLVQRCESVVKKIVQYDRKTRPMLVSSSCYGGSTAGLGISSSSTSSTPIGMQLFDSGSMLAACVGVAGVGGGPGGGGGPFLKKRINRTGWPTNKRKIGTRTRLQSRFLVRAGAGRRGARRGGGRDGSSGAAAGAISKFSSRTDSTRKDNADADGDGDEEDEEEEDEDGEEVEEEEDDDDEEEAQDRKVESAEKPNDVVRQRREPHRGIRHQRDAACGSEEEKDVVGHHENREDGTEVHLTTSRCRRRPNDSRLSTTSQQKTELEREQRGERETIGAVKKEEEEAAVEEKNKELEDCSKNDPESVATSTPPVRSRRRCISTKSEDSSKTSSTPSVAKGGEGGEDDHQTPVCDQGHQKLIPEDGEVESETERATKEHRHRMDESKRVSTVLDSMPTLRAALMRDNSQLQRQLCSTTPLLGSAILLAPKTSPVSGSSSVVTSSASNSGNRSAAAAAAIGGGNGCSSLCSTSGATTGQLVGSSCCKYVTKTTTTMTRVDYDGTAASGSAGPTAATTTISPGSSGRVGCASKSRERAPSEETSKDEATRPRAVGSAGVVDLVRVGVWSSMENTTSTNRPNHRQRAVVSVASSTAATTTQQPPSAGAAATAACVAMVTNEDDDKECDSISSRSIFVSDDCDTTSSSTVLNAADEGPPPALGAREHSAAIPSEASVMGGSIKMKNACPLRSDCVESSEHDELAEEDDETPAAVSTGRGKTPRTPSERIRTKTTKNRGRIAIRISRKQSVPPSPPSSSSVVMAENVIGRTPPVKETIADSHHHRRTSSSASSLLAPPVVPTVKPSQLPPPSMMMPLSPPLTTSTSSSSSSSCGADDKPMSPAAAASKGDLKLEEEEEEDDQKEEAAGRVGDGDHQRSCTPTTDVEGCPPTTTFNSASSLLLTPSKIKTRSSTFGRSPAKRTYGRAKMGAVSPVKYPYVALVRASFLSKSEDSHHQEQLDIVVPSPTSSPTIGVAPLHTTPHPPPDVVSGGKLKRRRKNNDASLSTVGSKVASTQRRRTTSSNSTKANDAATTSAAAKPSVRAKKRMSGGSTKQPSKLLTVTKQPKKLDGDCNSHMEEEGAVQQHQQDHSCVPVAVGPVNKRKGGPFTTGKVTPVVALHRLEVVPSPPGSRLVARKQELKIKVFNHGSDNFKSLRRSVEHNDVVRHDDTNLLDPLGILIVNSSNHQGAGTRDQEDDKEYQQVELMEEHLIEEDEDQAEVEDEEESEAEGDDVVNEDGEQEHEEQQEEEVINEEDLHESNVDGEVGMEEDDENDDNGVHRRGNEEEDAEEEEEGIEVLELMEVDEEELNRQHSQEADDTEEEEEQEQVNDEDQDEAFLTGDEDEYPRERVHDDDEDDDGDEEQRKLMMADHDYGDQRRHHHNHQHDGTITEEAEFVEVEELEEGLDDYEEEEEEVEEAEEEQEEEELGSDGAVGDTESDHLEYELHNVEEAPASRHHQAVATADKQAVAVGKQQHVKLSSSVVARSAPTVAASGAICTTVSPSASTTAATTNNTHNTPSPTKYSPRKLRKPRGRWYRER